MAKTIRVGFGQVEPNHLSAQRNGQIYAQLPADDFDLLENGMFVKYDYGKQKCDLDGAGEWMLVFNEVKIYDTASNWRYETPKDFAMIKSHYTPDHYTIPGYTAEDGTVVDPEDVYVEHDRYYTGGPIKGQMVPRVFKTNIGDIFTTNCFSKPNVNGWTALEMDVDFDQIKADLEAGTMTYFTVDETNGYLKVGSLDDDFVWQVAQVYTMPDTRQPGLKLQRVK